MFCYNVNEKRNQIPAEATVCVEFSSSHHVCIEFSLETGFLPHPKYVHIRLIGVFKLFQYEWVCVCVWVYLVMKWHPIQGWLLLCSLSCQIRLQPPATLNWNKQIRNWMKTQIQIIVKETFIMYMIIILMHDDKWCGT